MRKPLSATWVAGAIIVLMTLAAYLPTLRDGFIWDDDSYVSENRTLDSLGGLRRIWFEIGATPQYYPMVFTTFWIERRIWGLSPAGYHAGNVLLHAGVAVLLWRLLRKLGIPGAWLAAALFALHPVHVESVAWITERKNVLSGVFYMLAFHSYLRFSPIDRTSELATSSRRPIGWYLAALGLFVCALLSKSVTATLPGAIALVLIWKLPRARWRDFAPLLPFVIAGAAMGSLTSHIEKTHVGSDSVEWGLTFPDRCIIAGRNFWFYLGKLFWPQPLIFTYPRWAFDRHDLVNWIAPGLVVPLIATLWCVRRLIGSGPFVAALFFVGTLVPALGFVDVYPFLFSFVADHFQYLASIGPIALAAAIAARCHSRWFQTAANKNGAVSRSTAGRDAGRYVLAIPAALLLILAVLTFRQTFIYRDLETLWRDTIKKNPESWMAHNNLGVVLAKSDRAAEAIGQFTESLRLKPDNTVAYNGLGDALCKVGRVDEAIENFREAIRRSPQFFHSHFNLAVAYEKQGKLQEAAEEYRTVLAIKPDLPDAHANLAIVLEKMGKKDSGDESMRQYRLAVQSATGDREIAVAEYNLAAALLDRGETDAALKHLAEAVRRRPDYAEAQLNLANLLYRRDRPIEAIEHYRKALELNPDNVDARFNLGVALAKQRHFDEGIQQFRDVVRRQPNHLEAHYAMARTLDITARSADAEREYREVLRINPKHAAAQRNLAALLAKRGPATQPAK